MTASKDPLTLLREFTIASKSITLLTAENQPTEDISQAKTIKFNDQGTFSRDEPTTYKKKGKDDTYTLGSLIFFLRHKDESFYTYIKSALEAGVPGISFTDKGDLVAYLTGQKSSSQSVIEKGSKRQHEEASGESDAKRARPALGRPLGVDQEGDAGAVRTIESRERVLISCGDVLNGAKSFGHLISVAESILSAGLSDKGHPSQGAYDQGKGGIINRRKRRDPIIIVPAAATALLNMYNIHAFLKDQRFVHSQQQMSSGQQKPREVIIERAIGKNARPVKFRVIDSVQGLHENEWQNIVCVFTQGAEWQFKNWKWKSPEEIFSYCMGIYPKFPDEHLRDNAKTWNIGMLDIERSRRYTDRAKVLKLWEDIDNYISTNKPHLIF